GLERNRAREGAADDRDRRRPDEPSRRRADRGREGSRVRPRREGLGACVRRVLPLLRRPPDRPRCGHDRHRAARRLAPRRGRDRRRRTGGRRDGLHRPPPFPALAAASNVPQDRRLFGGQFCGSLVRPRLLSGMRSRAKQEARTAPSARILIAIRPGPPDDSFGSNPRWAGTLIASGAPLWLLARQVTRSPGRSSPGRNLRVWFIATKRWRRGSRRSGFPYRPARPSLSTSATCVPQRPEPLKWTGFPFTLPVILKYQGVWYGQSLTG